MYIFIMMNSMDHIYILPSPFLAECIGSTITSRSKKKKTAQPRIGPKGSPYEDEQQAGVLPLHLGEICTLNISF